MLSSTNALDVRPLSRLFKALGDETRLRIVALLSHGELCVCHVEAALGLSQPHVSRHTAILRAAGVVEHRRDGTWGYYRLAPQADADCRPVLLALASQGGLAWREVPAYLVAQVAGAIAGVAAADLMFELPAFSLSQHARSGPAQLLSEFIATFGLLSVIWGCSRARSAAVPFAV